MNIEGMVADGDVNGLQDACDALRRSIRTDPPTIDNLTRYTAEIRRFQTAGVILALRMRGYRPEPPIRSLEPIQGLMDYLAALVDYYPYELSPPDMLFLIAPAAAALAVPALAFAPVMFPYEGDAERHFNHMTWLLETAAAFFAGEIGQRNDAQRLLEAITDVCNMLPLYFVDKNIAPLAGVRARLTREALRRRGKQLELVPPRPVRAAGRRRVAVYRNVFNNAAEVASLRAHLLPYDRERYEIILYALSESGDSAEQELKQAVDRFVLLENEEPDAIVAQMRADEPDILLVGKNICGLINIPWVVAAHRIAPLQIATTLFPITTGLPSFDAYFTATLNEDPAAASHYTETLIKIEGTVNVYNFSGPPITPQPFGLRAQLGVGPERPLFASGANLHKLTPDLLAVWARILKARPDAVLALYPFNLNWSTSYDYRLTAEYLSWQFARHGVGGKQVSLFPTFPGREPILGLLQEVDVYLDSFPFSGAVSVVDPLLCDLPIVALAGTAARCRQSTGFLKSLGLGGMTTACIDEYVRQALALADDPAMRRDWSARIRAAKTPDFPAGSLLSAQFWQAMELLIARRSAL
jgi:hypothetical protein